MEEQVNRLVNKTWAKFQTIPTSQRLLIGVSGIPGSGKTTLAAAVTQKLAALHARHSPATHAQEPLVTCIPMDGYHLSRAQLSALPDPATAHARRGAAFTFDGAAFLGLVARLREPVSAATATVYAPSFDHAVKDPVAGQIAIGPSVRIVVLEGNYLALDEGPWREAARMMDELWFVEVEFEVARRRLVERHVRAGIARDGEEAGRRADGNDLVNGREIVGKRLEVDEVVYSREDGAWVPGGQGGGEERLDGEMGGLV